MKEILKRLEEEAEYIEICNREQLGKQLVKDILYINLTVGPENPEVYAQVLGVHVSTVERHLGILKRLSQKERDLLIKLSMEE